LVASGAIVTPHPHFINNHNFPLRLRGGEEALAVLVPLERERNVLSDFADLELRRPTKEDSIRFASQCDWRNRNELHVGRTIIFPTFTSLFFGVEPMAPSWLTLVWRPERGISELCLYYIDRDAWPENSFVIGIARCELVEAQRFSQLIYAPVG